MWNDINDWHLDDGHSETPLSEIASIPDRIYSLIARNKTHSIIKGNFLRIMGAAEIIYGIQYHRDQFLNTIKPLSELSIVAPESKPLHRALNHEAVAYVNRVGQFWYFLDSAFVREKIVDLDSRTPTIRQISVYRNKHSAHRSIDSPKTQDTPYLQQQHASVFTNFGGLLGHPKDPSIQYSKTEALEDHIVTQRHLLKNYILHQIQLDDGKTVLNISVERDHPLVMSEAWDLMSLLYQQESTS